MILALHAYETIIQKHFHLDDMGSSIINASTKLQDNNPITVSTGVMTNSYHISEGLQKSWAHQHWCHEW